MLWLLIDSKLLLAIPMLLQETLSFSVWSPSYENCVIKRDGSQVPFNAQRISEAIFKSIRCRAW